MDYLNIPFPTGLFSAFADDDGMLVAVIKIRREKFMHIGNLDQAFKVMNDAKKRLQECVDHCRNEGKNVDVTACKTSILSVANVCEAEIRNIEKCIELCQIETQRKAA